MKNLYLIMLIYSHILLFWVKKYQYSRKKKNISIFNLSPLISMVIVIKYKKYDKF